MGWPFFYWRIDLFDDVPCKCKACELILGTKPQEATPRPMKVGRIKKDVNPMRYEKNEAAAVAVVQGVDSDLTKARRYLKDRVYEIDCEKDADLREQFFIDAPEAP